jgi:hypothetical protein
MFGFVVYAWPSQLSDCWWMPMERMGFTVQQLPAGGIVEKSGTKVKVLVGKDNCATIYGWSFPWTRRRKLGYAVERILLASGMQAFCKPHSTNLIYQLGEEPGSEWLERVKPEGVEIRREPDSANGPAKERYQCGSIKSGTKSIRFWTGPAINPESKSLVHYLALDADAPSVSDDPLLCSLDLALSGNGARRLDTQRKLDR